MLEPMQLQGTGQTLSCGAPPARQRRRRRRAPCLPHQWMSSVVMLLLVAGATVATAFHAPKRTTCALHPDLMGRCVCFRGV